MAKPGRVPAQAAASRQHRSSEKPEPAPGDGAQEEGVPSTGRGAFECREMTLDSTLTAQGLFSFSQMKHINNFRSKCKVCTRERAIGRGQIWTLLQ